jgi:hypothetical protein
MGTRVQGPSLQQAAVRRCMIDSWLGEEPVLHKTSKVRGYHVRATDGEIGHVTDFLVDDTTWKATHLVVDTSNWIGGKSVLIAVAVIAAIDSPAEEVRVTLSRAEVEGAPSVESVEIELIETMPSVWIL